MTQKLLNRAQLAKKCGVSAQALTKIAKTWPEDAFVGKKVDVNHDTVAAYIAKHAQPKTPEPEAVAVGVDPLWEHALAYCYESGHWTVDRVKKHLGVGHARAKRIVDAFKANELLPGMKRHRPPQMPSQTTQTTQTTQEPDTLDSVEAEAPEELRDFLDWTMRDLLLKFGTHTSFSVWLKSLKELEMIEEKRLKNAQTRGELVTKDEVDRMFDIIDTQHLRLLKDGAKSISSEVLGKHQAGVHAEEIEAHVSKRMGTFITAAKNKLARLETKGRSY